MLSCEGWRKGRGGCVRKIGHEHDFCQAQKAGNTDPRTNNAVKYATAEAQKPTQIENPEIPKNSAFTRTFKNRRVRANFCLLPCDTSQELSGTKIASQNRSDHGGRKRARNHSAAEIARFFALPAAKNSLAASDFWGLPQNRRKIAATTAASRRSRAILRPQRPRDTKVRNPTEIFQKNLFRWTFFLGNGPNTVSGSTVSNTKLSECEFLSAYYLCAKANSPSFSQNSPSLPQNSVRLSEFSPPKQYSRNSIPLPFPILTSRGISSGGFSSCDTAHGHLSANKGLPHTPWARGLRDQIQKWALQTLKTLYF